ncbi:MAG: D-xylose 1-dehydrogenase D-xylono,5-lactone-forming [Ilumatobacteraceae bacterium]|nr:D-xylose 1-dehydrogenase D-xylono,5-lactone-forming [Ilumatobacteraceae bacterium]
MIRWGVLGGSSRIYHNALRPAFDALGHVVVDAPSRRGDDFAPYDDMLARDDIDAVYNPLPNHLHAEWSHRALDAGKHVLCEKPLTMAPDDSVALFDHAEAAGLTILEAYMWPHHDRARKLLALVHDGSLGTLQSGRSSFSYPMDMSSGDHRIDPRGAGALFDIGIYCIAPFMLIAGRDASVTAATATRNEFGADTVMSGWIDWGNSFSSTFDVSFDAPVRKQMGLSASEGLVELPGEHVPGPRGPSQILIERRDGSVDTIECEGSDAYVGMVSHFEAVVAGEQAPIFGRQESMRLAAILDDLHKRTTTPD